MTVISVVPISTRVKNCFLRYRTWFAVVFVCWLVLTFNYIQTASKCYAPHPYHNDTAKSSRSFQTIQVPYRQWILANDTVVSISPIDAESPIQVRRQWIQANDMGVSLSPISVDKTYFQVLNTDTIYKGDAVYVKIEARDNYNQPRFVGGDFWFTSMSSNRAPVASIAGKVTDYNNGTYLVQFLAAWAGRANITITLVHPSEATDFLKNTFWVAEEKLVWKAKFESGTSSVETDCTIQSPGIWNNKCIYPYPIANGLSSWVCSKPKDLPCSAIKATIIDSKRITARYKELCKGKEFLFEGKYYQQQISGKIGGIHINDSSVLVRPDDLPKCHPGLPLPSPKGYWYEGQWFPLNCRKFSCLSNAKLIGECIRNKLVIALGDSNARQWVDQLLGLVLGKPGKAGGGAYTHHYVDAFNVSIDFHFHRELISSVWIPFSEPEYEVDMLDEATNTECNYVMFISTWAHFPQWSRKAFTERLLLLRDAVMRFRLRCPHAPVIMKSPHPREHRNVEARIESSDYLLNEIRKLSRRIFINSGIMFIDTWDMTLSHPNHNSIHMPASAIHQELAMILSYVCKDSPCRD